MINMVGRLRPDAVSALHSAAPFISGRFKSTIRQVSPFGIALAISALGRSKVRTLKPAVWINLDSARRTDGSSSTTTTVGASPAFVEQVL